jgi:aspartate/methionine/tyrosine aminotransferase
MGKASIISGEFGADANPLRALQRPITFVTIVDRTISRQGGRAVALPLWFTKLLIHTGIARFMPRARRLTDGGAAFLRYYSDRVLTAPVEELLDPAYVPDTCGPEVFDLNPPAPRSESGVSLGRFTGERRGNPPPQGLPELRTAIAQRYQWLDGRGVNPETEVLVTHGATGALAAALDALVNPGDRVVLFDPCSPLFALGAKSRGANVRWVPTWMEDGRCRYLSAGFERAMRGAKMLILSNPGNPAGGCLSDDDLEHIAWIAAAYKVLIYADESFTRFRFSERGRPFGKLDGADKRILTAGSVTQEFGLGSLRVGWLAGPRHLVRACGLMQNLNAPFVPAVCQQAAARVIAEPDEEFTASLDRLRGKRDFAMDRLHAMGIEADRPAGGLFVWVPVAGLGLDGRTFAERLFREERVQVGPGVAFGPSGAVHIRIGYAGDDGRLREGLSRMAAFVERLKNSTAPKPEKAVPVEAEVTESKTEEMAEQPKPTFSRA